MKEPQLVRDYYANRNKLILLEAKLHDALCKVSEDAYWSSSGGISIHQALVHPEWEKLKDRVKPSMMIWQIAYMVYPFKDIWHSYNPFGKSYFTERLWLTYSLIECIENGYIRDYQIPFGIPDKSKVKHSSLLDKSQIEIHIKDLSESIKKGGLSWIFSKWVKLWNTHIKRSSRPSLPVSPPPEPVHVVGMYGESAYFKEIDGQPFELHEVEAPEYTGIKKSHVDSFEFWQARHRIRTDYPMPESVIDTVENQLNVDYELEVEPAFEWGQARPLNYKFSDRLGNKHSIAMLNNFNQNSGFKSVQDRRDALVKGFQAYAEVNGFDYLGKIPRKHKSIFLATFEQTHVEHSSVSVSQDTLKKDWQKLSEDGRLGKGFTTK